MDIVIIDGLSFALPLFVIAIGGIYCERSGVTNLALEGMLGFGAFSGGLAVVFLGGAMSPAAQVYLAMACAIVGGGLYAMLHGLLCVGFKANQVISGVVINILAMALTSFLIRQINSQVFGQPSDKFQLSVASRFSVPGLSRIPVLGAVFTNLYPFQVVIVMVAVISWYVLYRTRYGMWLRACGDNPHAVDGAGVDVQKVRFIAVMVSGALSGLGGISFAYSISANVSQTIYVGSGYLAIAALIFGNWKIVPTLFACLLFGLANSGGNRIAQMLALHSAFTDLMQILPYVLTLLLLIFFSGSNRAPRALGEIYDKGKR